jgi:hypothetical protein
MLPTPGCGAPAQHLAAAAGAERQQAAGRRRQKRFISGRGAPASGAPDALQMGSGHLPPPAPRPLPAASGPYLKAHTAGGVGVVAAGGSALDGWSVEEVQQWLQLCGCATFCPSFRANDMDGRALYCLAAVCLQQDVRAVQETLREDFGVGAAGPRLRLVAALQQVAAGAGLAGMRAAAC